MIQREVAMRNVARVLLASGVVSAIAMALLFGANYVDYVKWTRGAQASFTAASIEPYDDTGRLTMMVGFEAPAVGYGVRFESVEFTLESELGNLGYYRVIIPDEATSWVIDSASAELSLISDIPTEHWPSVQESSHVTIDATLVIRLYLPARDIPLRMGLTGAVDKEAVR